MGFRNTATKDRIYPPNGQGKMWQRYQGFTKLLLFDWNNYPMKSKHETWNQKIELRRFGQNHSNPKYTDIKIILYYQNNSIHQLLLHCGGNKSMLIPHVCESSLKAVYIVAILWEFHNIINLLWWKKKQRQFSRFSSQYVNHIVHHFVTIVL